MTNAAKKYTFTCTTPNGSVTRTTHRIYTHVVVILKHDGTAEGLSWCGSPRLAQGQLSYWRSMLTVQQIDGMKVEVFPVDNPRAVN